MIRDLCFLAGEFRVTQPLVFLRPHDRWWHTMTSKLLSRDDETGRFHRPGLPPLRGFIYYARAEDISCEEQNLLLLHAWDVPCWPNPSNLAAMTDRHEVMLTCVLKRFVDHVVMFATDDAAQPPNLPYPYVMKVGQAHSGEGKILVRGPEDVPSSWEGTATCEPFFEGRSARILLIGNDAYGIWTDNPNSWIKNSAGAETSPWPNPPASLVQHARGVADYWSLDVAGIDYIIGANGTAHFLELNQFPGLDVTDEIVDVARKFLGARMDDVEHKVDAQ